MQIRRIRHETSPQWITKSSFGKKNAAFFLKSTKCAGLHLAGYPLGRLVDLLSQPLRSRARASHKSAWLP